MKDHSLQRDKANKNPTGVPIIPYSNQNLKDKIWLEIYCFFEMYTTNTDAFS